MPRSSLHKSAAAPQQIPARKPVTIEELIELACLRQTMIEITTLAREIVNASRGTVRRKAMRIVELSEGGVK